MANQMTDESAGRNYLKSYGYDSFEPLDSGGQGNVYKTTKNKVTYACKVIRNRNETDPKKLDDDIQRELSIMKNLHHTNCIQVNEMFRSLNKVYIVMDFMCNGNVGDLVRKQDGICEWNAKCWFCPIARAVRYIHRNGVVHRDIKLDNILLDSHHNAVLSDFGFSRFTKHGSAGLKGSKIERCDSYVGTPSYMPPEIIARKPYDPFKADVWCLGVSLFIMLNNSDPFQESDSQKNLASQRKRNYKFRPEIDSRISNDVKDLVRKMLDPKPKTRISIQDVCNHFWFPKDQFSIQ